MIKPSEFFKLIPENEWNEKMQDEAKQYDERAEAHLFSSEESLTGEKLLEMIKEMESQEEKTDAFSKEYLENKFENMQKQMSTVLNTLKQPQSKFQVNEFLKVLNYLQSELQEIKDRLNSKDSHVNTPKPIKGF